MGELNFVQDPTSHKATLLLSSKRKFSRCREQMKQLEQKMAEGAKNNAGLSGEYDTNRYK